MKPPPTCTTFILACCASFAACSATAADTSPAPTPNAAHYQDSSSTPTYYPSQYWPASPGNFGSSSMDHWGSFYLSPLALSGPSVRILFPPAPPALGEFIRTSPRTVIRKNDVESQLAPYANQSFYAPLSGLLTSEDLTTRRRKKLESYRVAQSELLIELRSRIESLRNAPSETKREQLQLLAQQQAARLSDLEAQEEDLRSDFVHGGFFSTGIDWNDSRGWRLGDDLAFESAQDEARVMRAASYFQDGLSEPQRRLLRELAVELAEPIADPTAEIALERPKPYFFFSPETSRIRLPYDMPAELSDKIELYNRNKAELKRELRELLYRKDRTWFASQRTRAVRELADRQASRIAELDTLADEIRTELSAQPDFGQPRVSDLPVALEQRIKRYSAQRLSLENAYAAKRAEVFKAFSGDRVDLQRSSAGVTIAVTPSRRLSKAQREKVESGMAELALFNRQQNSVYRDLAKEKDAIRSEVANELRGKNPLYRNLPVDELLEQLGKVFDRQIAFERYSEYQIAVLEPGLSPAQRRLLYGAALERFRMAPSM